MTRRTSISMLLVWTIAGVYGAAYGHDAWIEAEPVQQKNSTALDVRFFIGHQADRESWPVSSEHVSAFFSVGSDGRKSHLSAIPEQALRQAKRITTTSSGAHLIGLDTFRRLHRLNADKFNAYVEEEGITPIAQHRLSQDTVHKDGRELYSRHFKAIIASMPTSPGDSDSDHVMKPVGQLLEIIPAVNPYEIEPCAPLPLIVLYKGRALPGATLHINSLNGENLSYKIKSDAAGRATVKQQPNGHWYAHVAWAEVLSARTSDSEYATAFASLSVDNGQAVNTEPCS